MKRLNRYFLQSISCVYLFAFASLYVQIPGLYGDHGILPARAVIKGYPTSWADFFRQPSILRFIALFQLTVDEGMDMCCLVGVTISSFTFLFQRLRTSALYLALLICYLAVYEVGQTFLWFQWDILLLEVGFIAIFLADVGIFGPFSIPKFPHSSIGLLLIRWLLFKLMFSSGIVKLTSKCPTWWGLTALNYHYESQCIPTPIAWFAHNFPPQWFQKFSVASTFWFQIPSMLLFTFSPFTSHAIINLIAQIFLQLLIMITGNYNFFNLTTIALCISLLDGGKPYHKFFSFILPETLRATWICRMINILGFIIGVCGILWIGSIYFSLRFDSFLPPTLNANIAFTPKQLDSFIDYSVPIAIFAMASILAVEIMSSLFKAFSSSKTVFGGAYKVFATSCYSLIATALFLNSCISFCQGLRRPIPQVIGDLGIASFHESVRELNIPISSSYGLFRSMTGVGGRPEIIIEAAMSENGPWVAYEFLYKPGNVSRSPPFVAPHQPRLDWQMWFAALGPIEHSPWFISFADRLLAGEPEVLALISKSPFEGQAPKFLRAKNYVYHYSKDLRTKFWWSRTFKSEFLPMITRKDLARHVAKMRVPELPKISSPSIFVSTIRALRSSIGQPEGFSFLMSLFLLLVSTRLILNRLSKQ